LFGTNNRLADQVPIEMLRGEVAEQFTAVVRAARQMVSFQGVTQSGWSV
jgi:hypothetical protein